MFQTISSISGWSYQEVWVDFPGLAFLGFKQPELFLHASQIVHFLAILWWYTDCRQGPVEMEARRVYASIANGNLWKPELLELR